MDKFNFQDFQRNPQKYELFKTATVRNTMVHQEGETLEGTVVGIRFAGVKRNQLYRRRVLCGLCVRSLLSLELLK